MGDAVQSEGHALLKAVSQGKLRLARLLLEGGAYINEGNERGETALSAACTYVDAHVRARMVRYLLEQGADPNVADTGGRTALMRAVHARAGAHVISLLLKHGADPAHKDYSGESALTRALLHALRDEHQKHDREKDPDLDSDLEKTPEKSSELNHTGPQRGPSPDRDSDSASDSASLKLLLEACERRGQHVLILTCCSQGALRTIRQYQHCPPEGHCCTTERRPPLAVPGKPAADKPSPTDSAPQAPPPQISVNGHAPCDPTPSFGHAPCEVIAASPSDVHVVSAHGEEGVFSFSLAPPPTRPRPPRVLKRLNSEPWGLSAAAATRAPPPEMQAPPPETQAPPPRQEEEELQKPLSLVDRLPRRHSIETHDSALNDTLMLKERLTLMERLTLSERLTGDPRAELRAEPPAPPQDSERSAPRRSNLPPPLMSSSENLSSSSPLASRRGRQGAGLLERRGSGTLLLDGLSHQPRPFLPPLFNLRPGPAPAAPAPSSGAAPRRKKLLRRHSMQPEQMKLLSAFQSSVLRENETNEE